MVGAWDHMVSVWLMTAMPTWLTPSEYPEFSGELIWLVMLHVYYHTLLLGELSTVCMIPLEEEN